MAIEPSKWIDASISVSQPDRSFFLIEITLNISLVRLRPRRSISMAELVLKSLTKVYLPAQPPAVHQLDLAIGDGEFVALLGPSGCGKSTTLRMVAGLESVTDGEIRVGSKLVNYVHPKDRGIGLAFENYALYPPLKVRDNLAFNLKAHGVNGK